MVIPSPQTLNVGQMIEDGASVRSSQEAAQKVQQLEAERDSYKAERHMYQMKWLAAEDLLEAMKNEKQSLEVLVQLCEKLRR